MNNLIGQSLGRYHILEQLGEGGMAVVYKAYDTRLESEVAVKVIRTEQLAPSILERALKRFEREAKSLARLTHPNIVKVTDYGEYEGKPYLVMPYLPGGTLKQRLGRSIPWQEAGHILIPIAEALDYAHKQNVIHRDVKPSNILLTQDGKPMLSDFGVAKLFEMEETHELTATGAAIGTPEYMAPEQVTSMAVDGRADIYSLGIVFYEMVTGRKPYQADTPMAVMIMQSRDPLPRPKSFVSHLPDQVEQILLKALAKDREDRYHDMGEFAAALRRVAGQGVIGTQSIMSRVPYRGVILTALLGVFLLAIIGFTIWAFNRPGNGNFGGLSIASNTPPALNSSAITASNNTAIPAASPPQAPSNAEPFTFGLLLAGRHDDNGWNNATYDGAQYVVRNVPNTQMDYLENVYSGSPSYPGQTASQLATQMVLHGAKLVIFNSNDMKDEALKFARANPNIYVIGTSDDWTWQAGRNYQDSPNQIDFMGRMEYMKMIGGCAAALTTKTGKIGYLGPLINDETRRLSSSAYLGAKYCWTNVLKNDPAKLQFKVTWIGFWFNIPGVTSDPSQVADDFFNGGYDVVISGIDTTEALVEARKMNGSGRNVRVVAYGYKTNCSAAPEICLGVPYFNLGPATEAAVKSAIAGKWKEDFQWIGPDWTNINNPDTSAVGFIKGNGLSSTASTQLDGFIVQLAGGLNLWTGPINLQDGTSYLAGGMAGTDTQIWYLPQLLQGMQGQSVSK